MLRAKLYRLARSSERLRARMMASGILKSAAAHLSPLFTQTATRSAALVTALRAKPAEYMPSDSASRPSGSTWKRG